jgi:cold-inducible RNA-binding protein
MKIYVGNLTREVTEDDLREAFQAFGTLESVALVKDKFSGLTKGFAFIEMESESEGKAAIAGLHGKQMKGRSMDVNEARPREERKGNRGNWGGGRRGGGRRF